MNRPNKPVYTGAQRMGIRVKDDSGIAPSILIGTISLWEVLERLGIPEDEYMEPDGRVLTKEEYPALCAILANLDKPSPFPFGGNEKGFNIPDLRGRVIVTREND